MELNTNEKNLLNLTACHSICELKKDKSITAIQQLAFDGFDIENKEEYQVQIIVTRCKRDFIEPMVTLLMYPVN